MAHPGRRWYQFTLGRLFALTTITAVALALLLQWPVIVAVPAASVIIAAPIGVPLYFIGTMLIDKKSCTTRFLLAFFISECVAVGILFLTIFLLLMLSFTIE